MNAVDWMPVRLSVNSWRGLIGDVVEVPIPAEGYGAPQETAREAEVVEVVAEVMDA